MSVTEELKICSELEAELTAKANPNHNKCSGRGYKSWRLYKDTFNYCISVGMSEEEAYEKSRIPIPCNCTKKKL